MEPPSEEVTDADIAPIVNVVAGWFADFGLVGNLLAYVFSGGSGLVLGASFGLLVVSGVPGPLAPAAIAIGSHLVIPLPYAAMLTGGVLGLAAGVLPFWLRARSKRRRGPEDGQGGEAAN